MDVGKAAELLDAARSGDAARVSGLALALLSAIAGYPGLMGTGALFASLGAWIISRVLKSLSAAPPPR